MKQALLAVSFGTSVPRAPQDIAAVEQALAAVAPGRDFYRAYTSPTIRRMLAGRGETVPGLPEALEAPVEKGQTVGKVSIFQDDTLLNEYEVKAAADAPLLTFGGALELLWQCLLGA